MFWNFIEIRVGKGVNITFQTSILIPNDKQIQLMCCCYLFQNLGSAVLELAQVALQLLSQRCPAGAIHIEKGGRSQAIILVPVLEHPVFVADEGTLQFILSFTRALWHREDKHLIQWFVVTQRAEC